MASFFPHLWFVKFSFSLSLHFHLIIVASWLQASFPLADIYWVVQLITLETNTLFFHFQKIRSVVVKPFFPLHFPNSSIGAISKQITLLLVHLVASENSPLFLLRQLPQQQLPKERAWITKMFHLYHPFYVRLHSSQVRINLSYS